jgi:hypothetical protein
MALEDRFGFLGMLFLVFIDRSVDGKNDRDGKSIEKHREFDEKSIEGLTRNRSRIFARSINKSIQSQAPPFHITSNPTTSSPSPPSFHPKLITVWKKCQKIASDHGEVKKSHKKKQLSVLMISQDQDIHSMLYAKERHMKRKKKISHISPQ